MIAEIYNRRSGIENVMAGDIDKLGFRDGVDLARVTANFIPGAQIVDPVFAGIQGRGAAQDMEYDLCQAYGGNIRRMAPQSRAMARKIAALDNQTASAVGEASVSAGGSAIGGAVGSTLGPIGTFGGMYVGGAMAQTLFNEVASTQDQDAVILTAQIRQMQIQGQRVPASVVFAALAANVPGRTGKRMEDRLQTLTGTRFFHEAVAQGQHRQLQQMMREFDLDIRTHTHMPIDPQNVTKTVSRQYSELINGKRMNALALIVDPARMPAMLPAVRPVALPQKSPAMAANRTPIRQQDVRTLAQNLTKMGVTVAANHDGVLQLPSTKGGLNRGNT